MADQADNTPLPITEIDTAELAKLVEVVVPEARVPRAEGENPVPFQSFGQHRTTNLIRTPSPPETDDIPIKVDFKLDFFTDNTKSMQVIDIRDWLDKQPEFAFQASRFERYRVTDFALQIQNTENWLKSRGCIAMTYRHDPDRQVDITRLIRQGGYATFNYKNPVLIKLNVIANQFYTLKVKSGSAKRDTKRYTSPGVITFFKRPQQVPAGTADTNMVDNKLVITLLVKVRFAVMTHLLTGKFIAREDFNLDLPTDVSNFTTRNLRVWRLQIGTSVDTTIHISNGSSINFIRPVVLTLNLVITGNTETFPYSATISNMTVSNYVTAKQFDIEIPLRRWDSFFSAEGTAPTIQSVTWSTIANKDKFNTTHQFSVSA